MAGDDPAQRQTEGEDEEGECEHAQRPPLAAAEHVEQQADEAHGEVDHEEDGGKGDAVVGALGAVAQRRGQRRRPVALLVFEQFLEGLVHAVVVACLGVGMEDGEDGADVLLAGGLHLLGECLRGGIPPAQEGEHPEGRALAEIHDELQTVVELGGILVQLVVLSAEVLLQVGPDDVAAPLLAEEGVDAAIGGQLKGLAQRSALDLDDGLLAPLVGIEEEAREHLLSGIAGIAGLAVELLGEVDGEGLQRADAVVVENVQTAEGIGCGLGQHTRGGAGGGRGAQQEDQQQDGGQGGGRDRAPASGLCPLAQ